MSLGSLVGLRAATAIGEGEPTLAVVSVLILEISSGAATGRNLIA
jgi:hypothetical protein